MLQAKVMFLPVTAILVAFGAVGCTGENPVGPSPNPDPVVGVASVKVEGTAGVAEGAATQLRGIATRTDGSTLDVSSQASWLSSNPSVASVSGTGLLTATGLGTTDVTASYDGQTGRMTVTVNAAMWDVQVKLSRLTVLATCDDFTQGLTDAELAYKVTAVQTNGSSTTMTDTGYPGNPQGSALNGVRRLEKDQVVSLGSSQTFRLPGRAGELVRIEFRATEWDEQIVLIPPSTRWVRDSQMNDRMGPRTHSYANGAWTNLGPNAITLGPSGCRVRLDYEVTATER